MPRSRKLSPLACLAALAAGAIITLLVLLLLTRGPVLERQGPVAVPYNAGEVNEVRVLDTVTLYVDGEPRITATVIGSIALIMLATAAFVTAAALRFAGGGRRLVGFWAILTAGLGFAGADELLAIHETMGHNLRFLADLPGVSRPDDVVIALYLVPMAAFAYLFRDVLAADRGVAVALAGGLAFFALAAVGDVTAMRFEEHFELVAGLFIAAGVVMLVRNHLITHIEAGAGAQRRPTRPRTRARKRRPGAASGSQAALRM